jgi:hypothetical protein
MSLSSQDLVKFAAWLGDVPESRIDPENVEDLKKKGVELSRLATVRQLSDPVYFPEEIEYLEKLLPEDAQKAEWKIGNDMRLRLTLNHSTTFFFDSPTRGLCFPLTIQAVVQSGMKLSVLGEVLIEEQEGAADVIREFLEDHFLSTDPYGHMTWPVGNADSATDETIHAIYFDADVKGDHVLLDSVIDSADSTYRFESTVTTRAEAVTTAQMMADKARSWYRDTIGNPNDSEGFVDLGDDFIAHVRELVSE